MGIGYVAMLTAFYVDNGPHLPLWDRLPPITFWFLPSAVGVPIVIRAVLTWRNRVPKTHSPRARQTHSNLGRPSG